MRKSKPVTWPLFAGALGDANTRQCDDTKGDWVYVAGNAQVAFIPATMGLVDGPNHHVRLSPALQSAMYHR